MSTSCNTVIEFKINEFEGPLDLLLHLIKESKMHIMDIEIESITEQYINYLDAQEKMNLEVLPGLPYPLGANFDGKAYVLWSCGSGTCYHYFENIPDFNDGRSTFYKDTTIKADNDNTKTFDVNAQYKGWALPSSFDFLVNAYTSK